MTMPSAISFLNYLIIPRSACSGPAGGGAGADCETGTTPPNNSSWVSLLHPSLISGCSLPPCHISPECGCGMVFVLLDEICDTSTHCIGHIPN